jgi:hypothetical protein
MIDDPRSAAVAGEAHQGVPMALGDARILFSRQEKARTWPAFFKD